MKIQQATTPAESKYYIIVENKGPYLVFGRPPLAQLNIYYHAESNKLKMIKTKDFNLLTNPSALCRCAGSKNKPFCDGTHSVISWDACLNADKHSLLQDSILTRGNALSVASNEKYCSCSGLCNQTNALWAMLADDDNQEVREKIIEIANNCPSGCLSVWDNVTKISFEPTYPASLAIIEDKINFTSGPLWIKGGILIKRQNNTSYEQRNRVTLCRCSKSNNKPFCDGSHLH